MVKTEFHEEVQGFGGNSFNIRQAGLLMMSRNSRRFYGESILEIINVFTVKK